jgi:hypothetical protein
MRESERSGSWTVSDQKGVTEEVAGVYWGPFLVQAIVIGQGGCGRFLIKVREVGDVIFVPHKIRTLKEDDTAMDCGHRKNSEIAWG